MIKNPYNFTKDEINLITSHFSKHDDWYKDVFNKIRENLRNHLRTEQDNKCCYCKQDLGFDLKNVDIEHIIPKSEASQFTFNNKNLALSCPACNTIKHDKTVSIKNLKFKNHPTNSKNIKIVHPYFDEYTNHIQILNNTIYAAKTLKGSETISMCGLYRFWEVVEKAKKFRAKQSLIANVIEEIRQGGPEVEKLSNCILALVNKAQKQ
jgi:uncharacterized protein (TIGR02646 family)